MKESVHQKVDGVHWIKGQVCLHREDRGRRGPEWGVRAWATTVGGWRWVDAGIPKVLHHPGLTNLWVGHRGQSVAQGRLHR
jgi:hypothetical protein